MIMVALVRSWQDLAKILASIPMHLGKRAKIRVTGMEWSWIWIPVPFPTSFQESIFLQQILILKLFFTASFWKPPDFENGLHYKEKIRWGYQKIVLSHRILFFSVSKRSEKLEGNQLVIFKIPLVPRWELYCSLKTSKFKSDILLIALKYALGH